MRQYKTSFSRALALMALLGIATTAYAKPPTRSKTTKKAPAAFKVKRISFDYVMRFRGNKVGTISQTQTTQANGDIMSKGKSDSLFRVMFFRIKTTESFDVLYRKGQLHSFHLKRVQRGKKLKVRATRIKRGMLTEMTKAGKQATKIFAKGTFDATTRDLRIPTHPPGKVLKRNALNLVLNKITPQTLKYDRYVTRTILGKRYKLLKVDAIGKRGKLSMYITKRGFMVMSIGKIPMLGKIEIELSHIKGRIIQGF